MMLKCSILVLYLAVHALAVPMTSGESVHAAGHVLVRYAPGKAPLPEGRDTLLPQLNRSPYEFQSAAVLPGETVEEAVARLSADDAVIFAEPDFYFKTDLKVAPAPKSTSRTTATKYPNDYYYSTAGQWALERVNAPKAWGITTGSGDVRVCLLDSGVQYTHEDLAQNVEFGHDVVTGLDDAWDPSGHGHGTMMAGQIAASTNNYRGLAALAWNITLLPCKFIDEAGVGLNSEAIECMYWCREQKADIMSFSFGAQTYSQGLHDAMADVAASGALLVVASCNSGADNDLGSSSSNTCWPAAQTDIPGQLTVTATDKSDELPAFANFGAKSVHLAAPGVDVLSTGTDNKYEYGSGTSIAVPQVAAAAALVKSVAPHLTGTQIKDVLLANADHIPTLTGKVAGGARLNVYEAVKAVAPAHLLPPHNQQQAGDDPYLPPLDSPLPSPSPSLSPSPSPSPSLSPYLKPVSPSPKPSEAATKVSPKPQKKKSPKPHKKTPKRSPSPKPKRKAKASMVSSTAETGGRRRQLLGRKAA